MGEIRIWDNIKVNKTVNTFQSV